MKDIYIFSAGPGGRDVFQLLNDINQTKKTWNIKGYVDTDEGLKDKLLDGLKVFNPDYFKDGNFSKSYGVCGVLDPFVRESIIKKEILSSGLSIPCLIHPTSVIAHDFKPKEGLLIFSGVNISYNVKIDKYVLISFNSLVGHDSNVGEFTSMLPTSIMDGRCNLGKHSILGSGAILHPGVTVGSNTTIGIGTVLLDNAGDNITVTQLPRMVKLNK